MGFHFSRAIFGRVKMKIFEKIIRIAKTVLILAAMMSIMTACRSMQVWADSDAPPAVDAPVLITRQPADVTAPVGENAMFLVEAVGEKLQYQWQASKDGGDTWINSSMPGYKTSMLTIEVTAGRDQYQYRCAVTGPDGTAFTEAATLTVGDGSFAIRTQPEDNICSLGETAAFTVEAVGTGLQYRWQRSSDGGKTWTALGQDSSAGSTLTVKGTASQNDNQFRCAVSGSAGTLVSNAATLLVLSPAVSDTQSTNTLGSYSNKSDMMWTYLLTSSPVVTSYEGVNDKVYWGYTSQNGYSGVACYDLRTGEIMKTHLKREEADDHNNPSVMINNGYIVVSYPIGHNTGNTMNFQVSSGIESIECFQPPYQYESDGSTCYGQFFAYNNSLYSFFRHNNTNWHCVSSDNGGYTWGDEKQLICAPFQYYCKFQETTAPGLLRMCMYSNPGGEDPSIRMGYLDLNSGEIYNSDAQTPLGNWSTGVSYDSFEQIIIPQNTQRLFDVAITAPQDTSMLIAQFAKDSTNTARYCWYNNGDIHYICDAGECIHYSYQNGICFCGTDRVVLSRSDAPNTPNGKDYIEIWQLGSSPALEKRVYEEEKGSIPIRNLRPIVDSHQRVILWLRGYYDSDSYKRFKADTMIYIFDQDKIV